MRSVSRGWRACACLILALATVGTVTSAGFATAAAGPVHLVSWSGNGVSDQAAGTSTITVLLQVQGAALAADNSGATPVGLSDVNFECYDGYLTGGSEFGSGNVIASVGDTTTYKITVAAGLSAPPQSSMLCAVTSVELRGLDGSTQFLRTAAELTPYGSAFPVNDSRQPPPTPAPTGQLVQVTPTTVTPGGSLLIKPSVPAVPCPVGSAQLIFKLMQGTGATATSVAQTTVRPSPLGSWASAKLSVPATAFADQFYVAGTCYVAGKAVAQYVSASLTGVAPPSGATYVALGDSYSSGEGNAPFDAGTDVAGVNGCHRSMAAWPRLLGVTLAGHLACSGAVIQNLYSGQEPGGPDTVGQISRLRSIDQYLRTQGQHVTTVTLTISGNDFGFSTIVRTCYIATCLMHPNRVTAVVNRQQARVTRALQDIHAAAPDAHVYLVGYPRLFPRQQASVAGCTPWLSSTERDRANVLASQLDTMLGTAAQKTHLPSVSYVSVLNALDGHELCTADSWVFPIDPGVFGQDSRQGHPIGPGQQAIASIVGQAVKP